MFLNLKSFVFTAATTISAITLVSSIAPMASANFPGPTSQPTTTARPIGERLGDAFAGRGSIKFRNETVRVVSYFEPSRRDDRKVLVLNLSNGKMLKTLRLSGKLDGSRMNFIVDRGGFNVASDDAGQADISGRLRLTYDRTAITGFQGRVVFDNSPIEVNFSRYEVYQGQGAVVFREQSIRIKQIEYRHEAVGQPKKMFIRLVDGRQIFVMGAVRKVGNRSVLQVQEGRFGFPATPNDADLVGSVSFTELADGRLKVVSGSLKFDGQAISVRFTAR